MTSTTATVATRAAGLIGRPWELASGPPRMCVVMFVCVHVHVVMTVCIVRRRVCVCEYVCPRACDHDCLHRSSRACPCVCDHECLQCPSAVPPLPFPCPSGIVNISGHAGPSPDHAFLVFASLASSGAPLLASCLPVLPSCSLTPSQSPTSCQFQSCTPQMSRFSPSGLSSFDSLLPRHDHNTPLDHGPTDFDDGAYREVLGVCDDSNIYIYSYDDTVAIVGGHLTGGAAHWAPHQWWAYMGGRESSYPSLRSAPLIACVVRANGPSCPAARGRWKCPAKGLRLVRPVCLTNAQWPSCQFAGQLTGAAPCEIGVAGISRPATSPRTPASENVRSRQVLLPGGVDNTNDSHLIWTAANRWRGFSNSVRNLDEMKDVASPSPTLPKPHQFYQDAGPTARGNYGNLFNFCFVDKFCQVKALVMPSFCPCR